MATDYKSGQKIRLHDEDNLPYSPSNPLPVVPVESEGGIEIHEYNEQAVVKDTTEEHDYTVTAAKTLFLDKVIISGSSRAKFDLEIETAVAAGTFNIIATGFIPAGGSTSNIDFGKRPHRVAAGIKVRVSKTNLDNQDASLYDTIVGLER